MDAANLVIELGALLFLGVMIYVANLEDLEKGRVTKSPSNHPARDALRAALERYPRYSQTGAIEPQTEVAPPIVPAQMSSRRRMLTAMYYVLIGFGILLSLQLFAPASSDSVDADLPEISTVNAIITLGLMVTMGSVSAAFISADNVRRWFAQRIIGRGSFDPDSSVHLTAVVLSLMVVAYVVLLFQLSGGIEGLEETLAEEGVRLGELIFFNLVFVVVSFLGVGLFIRRDLRASLARLGLRVPTRKDVQEGVIVGVILFVVVVVINLVLTSIFSPELLNEQSGANDELVLAINSLPSILVVALSVGIAEELFFRGALQPIFGNLLVAVFFAAIHTQDFGTIGMPIIFVVGFGLGWLRDRRNTSAAIIAHFVYDFIILVLANSVSG